jgi:GTPase
MNEHTTSRPKGLLVSVQFPSVSDAENVSSLNELERLVNTLGYDVIGRLTQKRSSLARGTVLGDGKLVELASWTGGTGKVEATFKAKKSKAAARFGKSADDPDDDSGDDSDEDQNDFEDEGDNFNEDDASDSETDSATASDTATDTVTRPNAKAEVIIFDTELTPSQLRNLESATGVRVLDRTGVIIEIFSRHARTREARLQVEIARLKYLAPRMRETGGGEDRQGGGVGGKGAGESSQELDRRRIRDRIKELRDELDSVQSEHQTRRSRRLSENAVALIGYTNAGKSSLMRVMTKGEVYVADKLFATLDTTVRPISPETMPRILLSDTVGFIKKLPHDLVASFRSTLDEAHNADLLLYVADAADATFREQLQVTRDVLKEIGAGEAPSLLILNKRDLLSAEEIAKLREEFPDAVFLSTRDPEDLRVLREKLVEFFEHEMVDLTLFIPYSAQKAVGEIRTQMRVLNETFENDGTQMRVRGHRQDIDRLREKFSL